MIGNRWLRQLKERTSGEEGVTLIELIAALAISVMIGGALLSVLWPSMMRTLRLSLYNGAQRNVVLVNQVLVKQLRTADFVQLESGQTNTGQDRVVLWLYKGYPQNVYVNNTITPNASLPWLYNTSTVVGAPLSNSTQLAIVSQQGAYGAFVFTQNQDSTWTVGYTASLAGLSVSGGSTACGLPANFQSVSNNAEFTKSDLGVHFYFPDVTKADLGGDLNCKFVNSFIIRLSANYQTSTGQPATYSLTAGYHNRDVR